MATFNRSAFWGTSTMSSTLDFAACLDDHTNKLLDQVYVNVNHGNLDLMTKLKCAIQAKIAVADKIALKLDLDMVDNICKNLKYEYDSLIVNRPTEAKYFSREQEDDETFVWAGYVKPGSHNFVIDDPLLPKSTEPYQKSILVGPRKAELQETMTLAPQDKN